jgi:hypothetical protein
MFVLFPVFSLRGQFRRVLKMYCESVARDGCVERFISEIEGEAKLVTIVCNGAVKIIDEKLRSYPGKACSLVNCHLWISCLIVQIREMFQSGLLPGLFGLCRGHRLLEMPDHHVFAHRILALLLGDAPGLAHAR